MKKILSMFFISLLSLCGCNNKNSSTNSLNNESSKLTNSSSSNESTSTSSSSSYLSNSSISSVSNSSTSTSSSSQSSSSSSSSTSSSSTKEKLNIPTLVLNEENGVVTWDTIEGASYYNYIINDGDVLTTTGTTIELEDKSNLSVQAVSESNYSNWSNAVTYFDTRDVIIEGNKELFNVYFHDSNIDSVQVQNGDKVNRPTDPTKVNHTFENWYMDPFYTTLFDFDKPITDNTIVYAHYIPSDLVNNVYYWVKANEKMSANVQSSFTSESGWKFIPLKESANSTIKEFEAYVTVANASNSSSCYFLIMDGFDDNSGRTYYKNNGNDFKITENGTYHITFSVETLYLLNGNQVNAKFEKVTGTATSQELEMLQLDTPVVDVDGDNNIAFISEVKNADRYEVIINNGISKIIETNQITLNKGEHISVRALKGVDIYSNWSIPKANINYIYNDVIEEKTHAYVYFYESGQNAQKVEINTYVNELSITKDGYNFLGWYLDLAKTQKVTFPYLVTDNVVFYPKWGANDDLLTKEYYEFIDENNNKLSGLLWNTDNYDFYEYQTESVTLETGINYYVKSLSTSETWGPYQVGTTGTYTVYFSEEHIWNVNTSKASNVYFAQELVYIYFTNAAYWSGTIYAYMWNDASGDYAKAWPGSPMEFAKTNSYGQDIYKISVDLSSYDYIIFNNGSSQTVDLSLDGLGDGSAFYTKDKNSSGKYDCGTYTYA